MISKLWNIRLHNPNVQVVEDKTPVDLDGKGSANSGQIYKQQMMVEKVETILQILSSFEESAAECISEMLVHFTNGGFVNGAVHAHRLIAHVEVLFSSLEEIDDKLNSLQDPQELSKSREPKQLVKKIVYFFSILSSQQDLIERQAATRDMIQLVTSLAHVLKIIIRNALTGALRLEQMHNDTQTIQTLLQRLQQVRNDEYTTFLSHLAISIKDELCATCKTPIEEQCVKFSTLWNWHDQCFKCTTCQVDLTVALKMSSIDATKGLAYCGQHAPSTAIIGAERIRHLQQYVTMLCNSLSRLFALLKIDEKAIFPIAAEQETIQDPPNFDNAAKEEFFDDEEVELQQTPSFRRPEQDNLSWRVPGEVDDKNTYITDITGLQSLAARQAAALALHKYVGQWFTLEKLLQIADGPKSTIWSKMFGGKNKEKKKSNLK
jgi:hypothetical protein